MHDYGEEGAYDTIPPNHLVYGGGVDQMWEDGQSQFLGRVRYAGYAQQFGIDFGGLGPNGTPDQQLLDVQGQGFDVLDQLSGDLTASYTFSPGSVWGWYRSGTTTNYSVAAFNEDDDDHMITYRIEGLTGPGYDGRTVWLLLWDDQTYPSTDRDFNDLGVELTAVIPAPGAALFRALGLGLVGWVKRRLA